MSHRSPDRFRRRGFVPQHGGIDEITTYAAVSASLPVGFHSNSSLTNFEPPDADEAPILVGFGHLTDGLWMARLREWGDSAVPWRPAAVTISWVMLYADGQPNPPDVRIVRFYHAFRVPKGAAEPVPRLYGERRTVRLEGSGCALRIPVARTFRATDLLAVSARRCR